MIVPKDRAMIRATRNGFFDGIATTRSQAERNSFVKIKMPDKGTAQTFSADTDAELTLSNGAILRVPANSLAFANGQLFTGDARVAARVVKGDDDQLADLAPGAMVGKDEQGDAVALSTFGLFDLELQTSSGQELSLADGKEMELLIPIADELLDEAPDEILLWEFDLDDESWYVVGVCTKEGNYYNCSCCCSGKYCCARPRPYICLTGRIYNNDNSPAAFVKVEVEDLTDNFVYWGYTDEEGFFCGAVPSNANLFLRIKDLCGNVIYEEAIGPYAQDLFCPILL